jgi:hypothetical protein
MSFGEFMLFAKMEKGKRKKQMEKELELELLKKETKKKRQPINIEATEKVTLFKASKISIDIQIIKKANNLYAVGR